MPPKENEPRRTSTAPPGVGVSSPGYRTNPASTSSAVPIPGSSFAARFGQIILSDGIAAIPSALFHYQQKLGLSAQQVWFVSYILAHKWTSELPYPSMNKMARCAGLTRRVLQYRCNELHNCGYLKIYQRRGEKNDQETNAYDFSELFRRMEEILSEDEQPDNPVRADGRSPGEDDYSEYDPSFVARYGRVISKHGIAAVPRAIFTYQKALSLTPQQVWFVCYIFSFQWDTALPYPSLRKMAERTGYSRQHLINIKTSLVEAGYLRPVQRYNENGQDSNAYDFSGLLEAIRKQLQPELYNEGDIAQTGDDDQDDDDVAEETPQQTRTNSRQRQSRQSRFSPEGKVVAATPSDALPALPATQRTQRGIEQEFTGGLERPLAGGIEQGFTRPLEQGLTERMERRLTGPVSRPSTAPANAGLPRAQKRSLPEIETSQEETIQEQSDSNQLSPKSKFKTRATIAGISVTSDYIANVASDFSREFGDMEHEASNIGQALNLWRGSGFGEQEFVDLMQEARRLTRRYQTRPTWDEINNKMAYFFATLRDLSERQAEG